MSLDIRICDGRSIQPLPGEPTCQISEEGLYWHLHPLFARLHTETGQFIDLYGDASFASDHLIALQRMLTEARSMAQAQPASWQVHVGTQTAPFRREVHRPVLRDALLSLIDAWERIARRAQELDKTVLCFGD
jgi:hypothetical protein